MMMKKTPQQLRDEFWQEDLQNGGIIHSQYEEIKRILKEKDVDWNRERLKDIKQHAITQTGFYKSYKITDDFPVVNKSILDSKREEFTAKGGFQSPIHISSTSGSTGTPFSIIQDYRKRKRTIADLKVFGELCDYPSHERMIFFRVLNSKLRRTAEQEEKENIYYIDSADLSNKHLEEMKKIILLKNPRIIFSYSSTLVELAKYIEKTGDYNKFTMKSVLTGGEGLSSENRELLERVFGCTVYRRYSDMEMGILGQDRGSGSEYFLNWGSYYFECLKINSDEPAANGEVGRIVVTDLFNYAFPMIRYDTGDLGIMDDSMEGEWPRLTEIYGRIRDCVYTVDGKLISPAKISVMMWGAKGIKQWQFIQEEQKYYKLKLNCDEAININSYIKKFKDLLGQSAKIDIEFVDEIPVTSSNKRRAVVCNYQK